MGERTVRNNPVTTATTAELLEQRLAYSAALDEASTVTALSRNSSTTSAHNGSQIAHNEWVIRPIE
jgi:hypothetical protein